MKIIITTPCVAFDPEQKRSISFSRSDKPIEVSKLIGEDLIKAGHAEKPKVVGRKTTAKKVTKAADEES